MVTKEFFLQCILNPELLAGGQAAAFEKFIEKYPYCHLGRMLYLRSLYNSGSFIYARELNKNAFFIPSRKALFELINSVEPKVLPKTITISRQKINIPQKNGQELGQWIEGEKMKGGVGRKANLIERFIEQNPKIKPRKDGEGSIKGDLSEAGLRGDGELMTETFARLLQSQGSYERAIKAYEILSLKYPEKSDTFAFRIKKIKEELNNKK